MKTGKSVILPESVKQNRSGVLGYLSVDTIVGECSAPGFEKHIEIHGYNHRVQQTISSIKSSAGPQSSGRVDIGSIIVRKMVDCSTPQLMLSCCEGRHLASAKFSFAPPGSAQNIYYSVLLRDVLIVSIEQVEAVIDSDATVTELVELYFRSIEWEYISVNTDAKLAVGSELTGWDGATNSAL